MIPKNTIHELALQYKTSEHPNITREYFQHLFLSKLYSLADNDGLLFKGGTALRIVYGSPRFSEDLDFSLINVPEHQYKEFVESRFTEVLAYIEGLGIPTELGSKPGPTKEGYYGEAKFTMYEYPPVALSINVSIREGRATHGEIESIANNFVPVYNLYHMAQEELVDEKIDALLDRKKARDFYDVYFMMRKGMITTQQKQRLQTVKELVETTPVDFREELSVFLPQDQQQIIRDFRVTLLSELQRQLS